MGDRLGARRSGLRRAVSGSREVAAGPEAARRHDRPRREGWVPGRHAPPARRRVQSQAAHDQEPALSRQSRLLSGQHASGSTGWDPPCAFSRLNIRSVELLGKGQNPGSLNAPGQVLASARQLFPGGESMSVWPYATSIGLSNTEALTATPVPAQGKRDRARVPLQRGAIREHGADRDGARVPTDADRCHSRVPVVGDPDSGDAVADAKPAQRVRRHGGRPQLHESPSALGLSRSRAGLPRPRWPRSAPSPMPCSRCSWSTTGPAGGRWELPRTSSGTSWACHTRATPAAVAPGGMASRGHRTRSGACRARSSTRPPATSSSMARRTRTST